MRRWALVLGALAILGGGCSDGDLVLPIEPKPPVPVFAATPEEALRRLEWTWTNRDTVEYRRLFTSDFRFVFAALDTAGSAWRTTPWGRAEELRAWGHMVGGGDPGQPAIALVVFVLDRTFTRLADPRPGHGDPRYHAAIRTNLALNLYNQDGGQWNVSGKGLFYFVRGDSAAIPDDVRAELPRPDSTVWFIDRWEDETLTPLLQGPARALPSRSFTVGSIKVLYL